MIEAYGPRHSKQYNLLIPHSEHVLHKFDSKNSEQHGK